MEQSLQIAAVSRITGLSIDTIRAWERRYGIVKPQRGTTGARVYSSGDVRRLELAHAAVRQGHPIRRVAVLSDDEMRSLISISLPPPLVPTESGATAESVRSVLRAVDEYDLVEAETLLSSAALLLSPQRLILSVLVPIMHETGERWQSGAFSVAQEHFLSHLVRGLLGTVMRLGSGPWSETMIFATPPHELHEFGILFAARLAGLNGARSLVLGAAVPFDELCTAARRASASTVVIGSAMSGHGDEFAEYCRSVRAALSGDVKVVAGGAGATEMQSQLRDGGIIAISSLTDFPFAIDSPAVL